MWASPKHEANLVSVIIPTYNRAAVLPDAMESVFKQTYRPIELIIVDDGSTDSTGEIVISFSRKAAGDSLFTLRYIAKNNEGSQVARNAGVTVSTGEFLQFLDSDDILNPDKLANAVRLYREDPTIDFVYSPWIVDNGKRLIEMNGPDLNGLPLLSEAVLHNLCVFSPVYKRKSLLKIGPFNEKLFKAQDIEYCTRAISMTTNAAKDDSIGGIYRLGKTENSIVGSLDPDKLRSEWNVNRWQRKALHAEPRTQSKDRALALLVRRAQSIAERSSSGGCPGLGLRILITEYRLWWPAEPKRTTKCLLLGARLLVAYGRRIFQASE